VGVEWLPGSGSGSGSGDNDTHAHSMPPAHELALLVVDPSHPTLRLRRALSESPYGGTPWTQCLRQDLDALTRTKEHQVGAVSATKHSGDVMGLSTTLQLHSLRSYLPPEGKGCLTGFD